ncbi:YggS family pyridoxal phosphate-dependent enzyme [Hugenholtzia roseola]|uniref:YggS family pyridoxal phosphate-dependent enzyme n=1 Tax=Hugenholtzia roseola TaxID=1002 RepID=UPI000404333F|nr:YggS family pyridoxal phosphate-dependent enzyme [Hugenholtzia roseola]
MSLSSPISTEVIRERIADIHAKLANTNARLIAVTKTHPVEVLEMAYQAGMKVFGENRVQELLAKQPLLPKDIEWHLIGTLQRNKVKYIVPFITLIHSVDNWELLVEINKRAAALGRTVDCLLQVHIAKEDTKFGFSEEELYQIFKEKSFDNLAHVRLKGLMGMATFTEDKAQIRKEFATLKTLFDQIKNNYQSPNLDFTELSMGMSGDFEIAAAEGSTLVRVGSAIFGSR